LLAAWRIQRRRAAECLATGGFRARQAFADRFQPTARRCRTATDGRGTNARSAHPARSRIRRWVEGRPGCLRIEVCLRPSRRTTDEIQSSKKERNAMKAKPAAAAL